MSTHLTSEHESSLDARQRMSAILYHYAHASHNTDENDGRESDEMRSTDAEDRSTTDVMNPPESSTTNSPLAPSVEKAYYRKCIKLKRRLTEVEAANDEAKIRRVRLDRAVMKIRLERAFLLDELRKRMEHNVDDSEGTGDEGIATPPTDRPHRDKRRRQHAPPPGSSQTASISHGHQQAPHSTPSAPSHDQGTLNSHQAQPTNRATRQPPTQPGSPPSVPTGLSSATNGTTNGLNPDDAENQGDETGISREAGVTGEALGAGPKIEEDVDGDRKIVDSASANNGNMDGEQSAASSSKGGAIGFTAVNN